MSFDCYGKLVPAIATSWEANEDSTVWTFHLRDDVDWVDCNGEVKEHITATDFLVGLEWVLNASKNEANNTSMPTLYIVGAEEYYEKTKDMGCRRRPALSGYAGRRRGHRGSRRLHSGVHLQGLLPLL